MEIDFKLFSTRLLAWYGREHRALPWRDTNDPYRIWLSEVILQQTRVAQGLPYYERMLAAYPTVGDMAAASEEEVLRLWQGLGYYSRARNLHQAAKQVVELHDGRFPENRDGLLKLKGVGQYTAAAIASFAYDEPVAVVDGNVYRVLARVYGIYDYIATGSGQKTFAALAQRVLPEKKSASHNQAIMEFGALQCVPKSPDCPICPMKDICQARQTGKVNDLPLKSKKIKVRDRYFHYLLVPDGAHIFLQKRGAGDIWQGLYEPPLLEADKALTATDMAEYLEVSSAELSAAPDSIRHILTHQRIFARFFFLSEKAASKISVLKVLKQSQSCSREQVNALPKPKLIDRFLKMHEFV